MFIRVFTVVIASIFCTSLFAQQFKAPLPEFIVQNVGNGKVRIGWVNPFGNDCIQLNVQRSYDSVRGYRTIFSTQSPELPENGFIDNYVDANRVYYRIFYMLSSNAYFFTKPKKTGLGYVDQSLNGISAQDSVSITIQDSVYATLPYNMFIKFKDSIYANTKDSLLVVNSNTVVIRPYIPSANEWRPSVYLYTDRSGTLNLQLPQAGEKKYSLHVYEADGKTQLFFIRHITEKSLTIDKTNFGHAGWFIFELYMDDKLKERNKFYIQKEF